MYACSVLQMVVHKDEMVVGALLIGVSVKYDKVITARTFRLQL